MNICKFDNGLIHTNTKTNSTLFKLANENFLCSMCVRRKQHIM